MPTQTKIQAKPLFALGHTLATPGALTAIEQVGSSPLMLLSRHQRGDWGDITPEDQQENDQAIKQGFRVFSAYQIAGVKFWVITEADRSATTLLLPEEY